MDETPLYLRRTTQERRLLALLAAANPGVVQVEETTREDIRVRLSSTVGVVEADGNLAQIDVHEVRLRFPRFFPSVPIEAYLLRPVFHPNVHPYTGFVCLWSVNSKDYTVVEAIRRLQRVVSWSLVNGESNHVMQPRALEWYGEGNRKMNLPLFYKPAGEPIELALERTDSRVRRGDYRRRLS